MSIAPSQGPKLGEGWQTTFFVDMFEHFVAEVAKFRNLIEKNNEGYEDGGIKNEDET